MTPRAFTEHMAAAIWRLRYQHDQNMRLAWTMAALQRSKRMTPLKRLQSPPPKAKTLRGAELEARRAEFDELTQRMMPDAGRRTGQSQDTDQS